MMKCVFPSHNSVLCVLLLWNFKSISKYLVWFKATNKGFQKNRASVANRDVIGCNTKRQTSYKPPESKIRYRSSKWQTWTRLISLQSEMPFGKTRVNLFVALIHASINLTQIINRSCCWPRLLHERHSPSFKSKQKKRIEADLSLVWDVIINHQVHTKSSINTHKHTRIQVYNNIVTWLTTDGI